MNHFDYRGDELTCEGVSLERIASEVGTPAYVYSHATLTRHVRVFDEALEGLDHLVCYSVKASSNLAILRLLFSEGAGADIVSGGELHRVLLAGCDPQRVVFSGVGKTAPEMQAALEAGILAFNVESEGELELLSRVASDLGRRAPVSLRVNPEVDVETHPYIATGLRESKFGVPAGEARALYRKAAGLPGIELVGLDCHIGSQLTKTSPFTDAIAKLVTLVDELRQDGIELRHLDIGGGLGIPYGHGEEPEPPTPGDYGRAIKAALGPLASMKIICEPGRVIAGNAGVLLTRVLVRKRSEVKEFVVVDAAMNDLLRPSLYGSFHPIRPVRRRGGDRIVADVVGPVCETGDFLARDREIGAVEPGDLLAVGAAGAYGFSMSSNYNSRLRAAEILVRGDAYAVVRRRESLDDLTRGESIPDFLA